MSTQNINDIQKEIKNLEKKLEAERAKLTELNNLPLERKIAVYMHERMCTWNHTDGCGWYYHSNLDEKDWKNGERKMWLDRANKLLAVMYKVYNYGMQKRDKDVLERSLAETQVFNDACNIIDAMKAY
jgi:hypothetical protein